MGIRGKRKQQQPPSHAVRRHANRSWSDCSPAFRAEAGGLMLCEKATPKAGRLADSLASRYSESPLASHLAGHAHAEGGDAARALPHLLRASALQPNCLDISCSLASAHMALQQFGRAADECRRALAVQDPTDSALHAVALAQPPPPGPPDSSVPAALRVAFAKERLRGLLAQVSTLPTTAGAVLRQLCSGMTELQLQSFLHVRMIDLTTFFRGRSNPDEQQLATSLEAALEFRKATNTWQYWVCPQCKSHFPNADLFSSHMEEKHIKPLSESFPCVPKRISDEQLKFLVSSWDPVPKGDYGCKGRASILNQIKSLLIRLGGVNALSVDLMNKLTALFCKGEYPSFREQLDAIASLDTEALQTLASRLQLIAPAERYHEKKRDGDHDTAVHFRIEEETVALDFGDGNANGSVDRDLLISWLCRPVHERSWTSTRQDCITNGAEVLGNLEEMVTSFEDLIKLKCSLTDKDYAYFDQMASIDVGILSIPDGLVYLKKRLAKACTFDYSAIILPAFKAYLNAKMSPLLKDVKEVSAKDSDKRPKNLDDSGVSQDQSHEQLEQDNNVSQPHQEAKSRDETKTKPNSPTKNSYAAAHLAFGETAKENFLKCLREFKLNPEEGSFYAGELKTMVHRGSTTFCVYYKHTEHYNDLAKSLCQSYDRIKHILQAATIEFITEQKMEDECRKVSKKKPELYIYGLPPSGSVQALAVFKQNEKNVLVDEVQIYDNPHDTVLILTELGRNLYLGFLRFIIGQHKRGKSWNGILGIEDLQVRDGAVFEICKEPLVDATRKSMSEDFKKLVHLLGASFQKSDLCPVYFDHLEDDLSSSYGNLGTCGSEQTITFHKYLLSHLALKSAMARGHLWLDLYRVHQGLGKDDRNSLRSNLRQVFSIQNWTSAVYKHPMLKKVFAEGFDPKGMNSSLKEKQDMDSKGTMDLSNTSGTYWNHLEHLLLFIRHVTQHGLDHTKGEKGEQKLKNLMETDLIIAKYLPQAVMDLIRHLRSNKMVVCRCVGLLQYIELIDTDYSTRQKVKWIHWDNCSHQSFCSSCF